jgi:hypothetical protein
MVLSSIPSAAPASKTEHQRCSIVLFVAVDDNEVARPLPRFVTDSRPPGYPPVTQRGHPHAEIGRAVENARRAKRSR